MSGWSVREVRAGIRAHKMSFPAQIPVFRGLQRVDIQWRMVLLYFVRGWKPAAIGKRYGMNRKRVLQLLRQWTERAIFLGYVMKIPPEIFSDQADRWLG